MQSEKGPFLYDLGAITYDLVGIHSEKAIITYGLVVVYIKKVSITYDLVAIHNEKVAITYGLVEMLIDFENGKSPAFRKRKAGLFRYLGK